MSGFKVNSLKIVSVDVMNEIVIINIKRCSGKSVTSTAQVVLPKTTVFNDDMPNEYCLRVDTSEGAVDFDIDKELEHVSINTWYMYVRGEKPQYSVDCKIWE